MGESNRTGQAASWDLPSSGSLRRVVPARQTELRLHPLALGASSRVKHLTELFPDAEGRDQECQASLQSRLPWEVLAEQKICQPEQELAKAGPWAEPSLLPISVKLYRSTALSICLRNHGRFCAIAARLKSCNRDHRAAKLTVFITWPFPGQVCCLPGRGSVWSPLIGCGPRGQALNICSSLCLQEKRKETKDPKQRGEYGSGLRRGSAGRTPNGYAGQDRPRRQTGRCLLCRPAILGESPSLLETPLKNDGQSSHHMSPSQRGLP